MGPHLAWPSVLSRSHRRRVFQPIVCLRYPGLDPRVCLRCEVFLNRLTVTGSYEIPGSCLLQGSKNLRAPSLVIGSSTDRGNCSTWGSKGRSGPLGLAHSAPSSLVCCRRRFSLVILSNIGGGLPPIRPRLRSRNPSQPQPALRDLGFEALPH